MTTKFLLPLAALAMPLSAHAAEIKSADQITCELTGDCTPADAGANDGDRPDERSFSLRLSKGGAGKVAPVTNRQPESRLAIAAPARSADAGSIRRTTSAVRSINHRQNGATTHKSAMVGRSSLAVGFDNGSAVLDAAGKAQAAALLTSLTGPKVAGRKVLVAGHTDAVGDRAYNLDLSQRRAEALVDFLASHGLDRALLEARGFGFDQPLQGVSPKSGSNRRVEVSLQP